MMWFTVLFCIDCLFCVVVLFFFFKQKTAYEMRISDWSSDVCSSDLCGEFITTEDAEGHGRGLKSRPFSCPRPCPGDLRSPAPTTFRLKIGRASCRERVCQYV